MKIVYIAGKISDKNIGEQMGHRERAKRIAAKLAIVGIPFFCPHTHTADFGFLQTNKFWYDLDFEFLKICDSILLLDNWKDSAGSIAEYEYSKKHKKKIFYSLEEVIKYYKKYEKKSK